MACRQRSPMHASTSTNRTKQVEWSYGKCSFLYFLSTSHLISRPCQLVLITSKQTFHYAISIPNGQQVVASRLSFMIMFILCEPLLHCIIVATFLSFHIVRGDDEDDSRLRHHSIASAVPMLEAKLPPFKKLLYSSSVLS